ncbi:MAG: NAD-dependent epimerase/dehydratase family protein [Chitinophagaceae bacterium]|nr:NAD-dependent epimerase/dehydratase family protein [Chitinophagaceae bacterium]
MRRVVVASSRAIYGEGKYLSEEWGAVYPEHRTAQHMDVGNFEVTYPGVTKHLQVVATDEESKIHPSSVYGITKYNQEQMVMMVCAAIGIEAVAFRYQNVYGPGQSLSNPYTGILSIFSTLIKNDRPINIFEDGKEPRFYFYQRCGESYFLWYQKTQAAGQIFNVGTGVGISVLEVASLLFAMLSFLCAFTDYRKLQVG